MNILFRLISPLRGRRVGTDRFGNSYWEAHRLRRGYDRKRRWVLFAGEMEATNVPPEWHGWLHHASACRWTRAAAMPWQLEHQPNMTGTAQAYRPAGHDSRAASAKPPPATTRRGPRDREALALKGRL